MDMPKDRRRTDPAFTQKLSELRTRAGKTQKDLGSVIKVAQSRISKWETGFGYPEPRVLAEIAKFFEVSLDYLCNPSLNESGAAPDPDEIRVPKEFRTVMEVAKQLGPDRALARLIGVPE
jgi:transcriptional regulator with XRE-family HTH domain